MFDDITIFKSVTYIVIFVLGTIGNILVVLVVSKRRKMRTVTNYFILNLAVADLTVLISNIPVDLTTTYSKKWIFGKGTCKVIPPLQTMGTIASILTLVAISLSRYHAVVYPFHRQMKLHHARGIIVAIWIISLVGITPYALAYSYDGKECSEDFEKVGMSAKVYTLTMFGLQYVIPMAGMTYAYNRIGAELSQPSTNDSGALMDPEYRRESRKVVKMLSIVVAVFAILDLPIHVIWIWHDFFPDSVNGHKELFQYIKELAIIMLYGNSCTNPIIYSVCNDQFRTAFKDLFGSCLRACCLFVKFARISKNRETAYSLRENRDARSPVHGNTFTAKEAETQKNYENIETRSKDFPAESSNNKGTTILLPQSCKHEVMSLVTAV